MTILDPMDDIAAYAAPRLIRFVDGWYREVDPPNPSRVSRKEVARRRKRNKAARIERKRQRRAA